MFGGYNGQNYMGDTWVWDSIAQKWTQEFPTTKPTPVALPMLFTDPVSGHAEMVGGAMASSTRTRHGSGQGRTGSHSIRQPCSGPVARRLSRTTSTGTTS